MKTNNEEFFVTLNALYIFDIKNKIYKEVLMLQVSIN